VIFVCRLCGGTFADKASKKRVYCGLPCKAKAERKIDLQRFHDLAADGTEGKEMAAILGITRARVHRLLKAYGLYEAWRNQRNPIPEKAAADIRPLIRVPYDKGRKCLSSLLAGWKLVPGALEPVAADGLSAECT
jgi:hypothetical protein